MLKLTEMDLSKATMDVLAKNQARVNKVKDYPAKVEKAGKAWDSYRSNKSILADREEIKTKLQKMCSGVARCHYCEDSAGHTIDHIKPKALFPELTFEWFNFLLSCGRCNNAKGQSYKVFSKSDRAIVQLARRRNDPVLPPTDGDPVLIDPRFEDPLDYIQLDLITFLYAPVALAGSEAYVRGEETCKLLNAEDFLVAGRQNFYGIYLHLLEGYIDRKNIHHLETLRRTPNYTVWFEMKRQRHQIPELAKLFEQAPLALQY